MHTLDSSNVCMDVLWMYWTLFSSPEYSLSEMFIQFQILLPLQTSIIKSGNVYPRHRVACVLIEQKSAQEDVLSLVTVLLKYEG